MNVYNLVLSLFISVNMSLSAVARTDTISTNGGNSCIVRQPNISQNKWQSCIHLQHERFSLIYDTLKCNVKFAL
jgi:hypothetical protein